MPRKNLDSGDSATDRTPDENAILKIVDEEVKIVKVTNLANQPREFKIAGKWYRWEPRGKEGGTLNLPKTVVLSESFKPFAQYFSVQEA